MRARCLPLFVSGQIVAIRNSDACGDQGFDEIGSFWIPSTSMLSTRLVVTKSEQQDKRATTCSVLIFQLSEYARRMGAGGVVRGEGTAGAVREAPWCGRESWCRWQKVSGGSVGSAGARYATWRNRSSQSQAHESSRSYSKSLKKSLTATWSAGVNLASIYPIGRRQSRGSIRTRQSCVSKPTTQRPHCIHACDLRNEKST